MPGEPSGTLARCLTSMPGEALRLLDVGSAMPAPAGPDARGQDVEFG